MGGAMKASEPTVKEKQRAVAGGIACIRASLIELRIDIEKTRNEVDQLMFKVELDVNACERLLDSMERNNG